MKYRTIRKLILTALLTICAIEANANSGKLYTSSYMSSGLVARLLKERHVNVSQVAYALGFTNTAHSSKVFKQHFGVSPSEYGRKENENAEE